MGTKEGFSVPYLRRVRIHVGADSLVGESYAFKDAVKVIEISLVGSRDQLIQPPFNFEVVQSDGKIALTRL